MAKSREGIRKKIQARKAEKVAAEKAKYAKMKHVADNDPGSVEKDLTSLADACAAQAEAFDALRENLDLIQAPKEASLKIRVAAARNYGKEFKRIAEEAPQELASAVSEAYHSLDEQAGALEQLADHLGIDLGSTPTEEAFAEEGIQEMNEADEQGVPVGDVSEPPYDNADEKEAAGGGSDAWVTDRDESGQPRKPEQVEVPRVANSGPGAAGFVTDRDKDAKPTTPQKVKIPQAQGKTEVGAGKQSKQKPMTQIVPSGTPTAAPAAEFVKNIPQSQGSSESPGNKSGSLRVVRRAAAKA